MITLDRLAAFIGETARPLAIIVTSVSAAVGTVIVATRVSDGNDGAIFIGAVYAGVGALYGFKAWEQAKGAKAAADVEIARASTPPSDPSRP